MARLLDGGESIRRSLPETTIGQQSIKFHEANHRNLDDLARSNFYPDNRATCPILATFMPKSPAVKRMPAIMKLHQLRDMCRMTLLWLWAVATLCRRDARG